jgi:hypothetical protein
LTAFRSAAQRKILEFTNKILFSRATKIFAFQKQLKLALFCLARSENVWNLPTKATQIDYSVLLRSENFWITSQVDCILSVLPQLANTKATQIDCIFSCHAAKLFEFRQLKLTALDESESA